MLRRAAVREEVFTESEIPSEIVSAKTLPGNKLELVVRFKPLDGPPPAAAFADIVSPARGYERDVSVFASADQREWVSAASAARIYDYSNFVRLASGRIPLKPVPGALYFRFEISSFAESSESDIKSVTREFGPSGETGRKESGTVKNELFKVSAVRLIKRVSAGFKEKPVLSEYPSEIISRTDEKEKTVLIVSARRQPVTEIDILTPDINYQRSVSVFASSMAACCEFSPAGGGEISSVKLSGAVRGNSLIQTPEIRAEKLKIVIDNRSNPPLRDLSVKLRGPVMEMVFFKSAAEPPLLAAWGMPEPVRAPSYDTAALVSSARSAPLKLSLGPAEPNPAAQKRGGGFVKPKHLFWAALALMSCVLGYLIIAGAKKAERMTPGE
jgi:hypothetical protein